MLVATSVVSLLLVSVNGRFARRMLPQVLVPASFALSGALFVLEWALRPAARSPRRSSCTCTSRLRGRCSPRDSGSIASERFDPHTAKRRVRPIGRSGDARRPPSARCSRNARRPGLAYRPMLPALAPLQFLSASWCSVWRPGWTSVDHALDTDGTASVARSGLRVIAETPYLRNLAALVRSARPAPRLSTICSKPRRWRHSAAAITSSASSPSITRARASSPSSCRRRRRGGARAFGLGATASTPSLALLLGSLAGLIAPGFAVSWRRAAASRCSGARCFAPDTSCSIRRCLRNRTSGEVADRCRLRSAGRCDRRRVVRFALILSPPHTPSRSSARDRLLRRRHDGRQPSESRIRRACRTVSRTTPGSPRAGDDPGQRDDPQPDAHAPPARSARVGRRRSPRP